jgi:hypothetical protein
MNTTIDDGVNQLQVNGFVKSSGYRINGGTSTQYLMADGHQHHQVVVLFQQVV